MKEITFISSLDSHEQNRLRVHLQTEGGTLRDVMYQYETLINGQWVAIVRYDCAHGFFHRDVLYPNGDKGKAIYRNGLAYKRLQICRTGFERPLGMV